jgi:hypothetical protein
LHRTNAEGATSWREGIRLHIEVEDLDSACRSRGLPIGGAQPRIALLAATFNSDEAELLS